ncbi:teashirt homolog 3b [Gouania willdenowi]|uniref:Teashirt zinc finger homeobox 3 n=1 Tax=Gouania willdenowi TaxID=441366 RepID=A0A8C5N8V4_GOUWI|nr:teashirt homolog 3 [Gouania willdenowi]XP_028293172.1 teashirt homolog 3 [Gouania willdenowi]
MPRRKQQAPRRAAVYVPEDEKEAALLDDDLEGEDSAQEGDEPSSKLLCQDKDFLLKDRPGSTGIHDSPNAADFSSQELDSESHLSESSDRLSDFESSSLKNEDDVLLSKDASSAMEVAVNTAAMLSGDETMLSTTGSVADSLEKMKAIYTSFLTNSYWSTLNLNLSQPPAEKPPRSHSSSSSSSSSSSCGSGSYDWHQTAMAKSLQQASQNHNRLGLVQHPTMAVANVSTEPNLFSTVQLYRQSSKLYGSIFTGASKFRCKDCSAAYDTLVQLTVHMNEMGHYRDDNHETEGEGAKRWSKPRKRSLLEMEGKEDAQKVLKCMYCGHSFESLQDLSVHMIKTKHYQKVPLKEPVTPVAAKIISSARKRAPIELDLPSSPDSNGGTTPKSTPLSDTNDILQKVTNPYITPNNRYGHQNGASYAWQFESRKSQILKCMECGSSHDTLQELTAHMMVTGHFIKVTNSAIKKGKPIIESSSQAPTLIPTAEEQIQSVPLAATAFSPPPAPVPPPASISPSTMVVDIKKEEKEEECTKEPVFNNGTIPNKDKKAGSEEDIDEKFDISSKYTYLTEDDLGDNPKGGLDILKSLENTVTSAINKAQNGAPSWGGYPSIHAAYQLPNIMKLSLGNSGKSSPLKYLFPGAEILSPIARSQPLMSPPSRQSSPLPKNNFHAMEELVKKVTEKVAKVEEKMRDPGVGARGSPLQRATPSPSNSETGDSALGESPKNNRSGGCKTPDTTTKTEKRVGNGNVSNHSHTSIKESVENGTEPAPVTSPLPVSLCGGTAIITDHPPPEQPFVNPLSALQSVMNAHLGKASKPNLPSLDPMSMLFKMSNSLAEKAAVAASTPPTHNKKANNHLDRYFFQQHQSNDQPIDLTKGKNAGSLSLVALSSTSSTPSSVSPSAAITMNKASAAVASFMATSPLRENALSDISDMLKNLTESQVVSKSSTPTSQLERSDIDGVMHEDTEDISPAQKRKGRQSNWNPQHLLILQAQFASSLRQLSDGKYMMSDLSPQERMHISRFTGLSMTTISHWLANVKYQLRRTGGTKFLKNLDSGHPVFFCSDCASQIRSPSTYVSHLESHLGFRLRDLAKLSGEQLLSQISQQHQQQRHTKGSEKLFANLHQSSHPLPSSLSTTLPPSLPVSLSSSLTPSLPSNESPSPDDDNDSGATHKCKLCNRTFASKHAVKLHLSKTHGKSPEDHLMYLMCELDKQ